MPSSSRKNRLPKPGPGTGPKVLWAVPEEVRKHLHASRLLVRLDVYDDAVLLHRYGVRDATSETTDTRLVSPLEIARTLSGRVSFTSGLLPEHTLWWGLSSNGVSTVLYRQPQVWRVKLQLEAFQPPRLFALPMPGCVFLCAPGRPPSVWAVKGVKRPTSLDQALFHLPAFNVFASGATCQGSVRYSEDIGRHPEEFFEAAFTIAGDHQGRSREYAKALLQRWESLDNVDTYPLDDLVNADQIRLSDILRRVS